uniref:SH2 domain containing 1A duplicate b n=1 Tax=Mastacembelus armatus TaxID=205130 RepID=A0A7N9APE2_9TELE
MENLTVYHGPIGKEEGERRLAQDGRDGCYLIRNSDSVPGVFCLCVLHNGYVYTYRLHKDDAGSWAAETTPGVQKRYFRKIKNLIAAFQKPGQDDTTPGSQVLSPHKPRIKGVVLHEGGLAVRRGVYVPVVTNGQHRLQGVLHHAGHCHGNQSVCLVVFKDVAPLAMQEQHNGLQQCRQTAQES